MTKPDWEDAPDWAEYLTHDVDGHWLWFKDKPFLITQGLWVPTSPRFLITNNKSIGPVSIEEKP